MFLRPGVILDGRYRIEAQLGRGGFGAVYRARDLQTERLVAIKENLTPSVAADRQFRREMRILADPKLRHPNLPAVYRAFEQEGRGRYVVMAYIQGEDLIQRLERRGPLPEAELLPWVREIAGALAFLHAQEPPIIHRDVKPANIRLEKSNGEMKPMLVDFGLAKEYEEGQPTTIGARAVTPGFSPPEQYGRMSTDARSDIYSLGATMYQLLTGALPPESTMRLIQESLEPAHVVNPQVSREVSAVVSRAMALNPAQRYQSMGGFLAALPDEPGRPARVSPPPVLREPGKGRVAEISAAVVAAAEAAATPEAAAAPSNKGTGAAPGAAAKNGDRVVKEPAVANGGGRPRVTASRRKRLIWVVVVFVIILGGIAGYSLWPRGSGNMPPADATAGLVADLPPADEPAATVTHTPAPTASDTPTSTGTATATATPSASATPLLPTQTAPAATATPDPADPTVMARAAATATAESAVAGVAEVREIARSNLLQAGEERTILIQEGGSGGYYPGGGVGAFYLLAEYEDVIFAYPEWTLGFVVRHDQPLGPGNTFVPGAGLALEIDAGGRWELSTGGEVLEAGTLGFDPRPTDGLEIEFAGLGEEGWLFVNGRLVAVLTLPADPARGHVLVYVEMPDAPAGTEVPVRLTVRTD